MRNLPGAIGRSPSLPTVLAVGVAIALTYMAGPPRVAASMPQAGEFVWRDLITDDAAASRTFYAGLFGWTFQPAQGVEPGYVIIREKGEPIGGIVAIEKGRALPQWLSYVMVANVDQASAAFAESGGRVYRAPLDVRKDLRVSVVGDAQGAAIGLASRGRDAPAQATPAMHRWLWTEYVAVDAPRALEFYSKAIGFTSEVLETRAGQNYHLLKTDRPRAGLFASPWKREASAWLPYVRVEDPAAMAKRVVELGGSVVLEPRPDIRNGSLAIVVDPTGAALALQKYPFDGKARS